MFSFIFLKKETIQIKERQIPVLEALEKSKVTREKQKEAVEPVYELIGGLSIPKINKQIKLYEEAIEPYISMGAGYEIPGRVMGQDNVVLAGHDYPELFKDLVQLELGDKLYVLEKNQVYTFQIESLFKAEKSNVQDLKRARENQKDAMLTVYTCFGEQGTPFRTVIQGRLIQTKAYESDNQAMKQLFSRQINT
ncbi:sortase [uncultured Vagococcus sp.]|uniref:sortase n=1 Tax=uncultured Vagococcus sp. TaxID=189676 RepID=UPI002586FFE8|nr:sortase [uncultured Vagococcus sp.]